MKLFSESDLSMKQKKEDEEREFPELKQVELLLLDNIEPSVFILVDLFHRREVFCFLFKNEELICLLYKKKKKYYLIPLAFRI